MSHQAIFFRSYRIANVSMASNYRFNRTTLARLFICAGFLALACAQAAGEDIPNVIGTWSVSDRSMNDATRARPPDLNSLTVKILRQNGGTFSGTVVGPKRRLEQIIGYIHRDGKTLVYSGLQTAGSGKVQGGSIELCRTDAGCAVLTRTQ